MPSLMLSRLARQARPVARRLAQRRGLSSEVGAEIRSDGFTQALPKRDIVAPLIIASIYGGAWMMTEEGRIEELASKIDVNTDPLANPTPNQVFHHLWPFVAGTVVMLFDSISCKFSQTKDMDWLCTKALNDDVAAAVALSLLTPAAEHSPALTRAICDRGSLPRIKEIVAIYKTLPREQHDDVVVNACILAAKVAALPERRDEGLSMAEFAWMMPPEKAHDYTPYGIEGLGALWKADTRGFLQEGGVARLAELVAGPPLRPSKPGSGLLTQMLAERMLSRIVADDTARAALVAECTTIEAALSKTSRGDGAKKRKTLWQAAGVVRLPHARQLPPGSLLTGAPSPAGQPRERARGPVARARAPACLGTRERGLPLQLPPIRPAADAERVPHAAQPGHGRRLRRALRRAARLGARVVAGLFYI